MTMTETLLETPLARIHEQSGAKMTPFAGWNMPVQYADGILAEHAQCRTRAAIFDICHMGELMVTGVNAARELDRLLARPVLDQKIGSCRYNFILNDNGCVKDDLIVYRERESVFMLVVNAGPTKSDAAWLTAHLKDGVTLVNASDDYAKVDLQGPKSADVMNRLGFPPESLPAYYHFKSLDFNKMPLIISRTGYTGELGFELYLPACEAVSFWNRLRQDPDVKPAGLGARDTLRLEMGYPLYGHEMDESVTPIEAGYAPILKLQQPRTFIGGDALRNPANNTRTLLGFRLDSRRAARHGAEVIVDGIVVGHVTSGAIAPSLGYAIALGLVDASAALSPGARVTLKSGTAELLATVTTLPFYTKGTARTPICPKP